MKCCTGRCFLITICVLQMLSTIERQVFDFMGYMWALILGNFLQLIFVIMGLFGAAQYRPKYIAVYAAWSLVWLAWNIFIICFYLDVGILSPEMTILDFGVGKKSWWQSGGIGCRRLVNQSDSGIKGLESSTTAPQYTDCLLKYHYVEVLHAGVQCIMALIGFIAACYVIYVFSEEDDSSPIQTSYEMEYVKMRYKSPARNSFRTGKNYDNVNHSNFNTLDVLHQVDPTMTQLPSETVAVRTSTPQNRQDKTRSSTRSTRSQRSMRSNKNQKSAAKKASSRDSESSSNNGRAPPPPPAQLPWVRISPSPHKRENSRDSKDSFREARRHSRPSSRQSRGSSSEDHSPTSPNSRHRLDFDHVNGYNHNGPDHGLPNGRVSYSPPPPFEDAVMV